MARACTLALAIFGLIASPAHAQSSANSISFQGALTGATGQPLPTANYNLTFKFYDVPTNGVALATSNVPNVPVTGGIASTPIPVDPAWFSGLTRYFGISIAGINSGQELAPRVLITAVPYAVKAASLINPFQTFQGIEIRRTNDLPYIDFTRSWLPADQDYDFRIYTDVLGSDPRFTIRSDLAPDCFVIRRNGYVGIGGGLPEDTLDVNGTVRMVVCKITSDRNAKTEFKPVDSRAVLNKLAALPISTWAYTNAPLIRHLGPVAQDFKAAFAVGEDDKHIATVDADGVALVAIQGLNQLVQEKASRITELENRLNALESKFGMKSVKMVSP